MGINEIFCAILSVLTILFLGLSIYSVAKDDPMSTYIYGFIVTAFFGAMAAILGVIIYLERKQ